MTSPRTYSQTIRQTYRQTDRHADRQTSRQTEIFFACFVFSDIQNMNLRQKERFFFFTHAIIILSLFTYSVCDEKVKRINKVQRTSSRRTSTIVENHHHQKKLPSTYYVWKTIIQLVVNSCATRITSERGNVPNREDSFRSMCEEIENLRCRSSYSNNRESSDDDDDDRIGERSGKYLSLKNKLLLRSKYILLSFTEHLSFTLWKKNKYILKIFAFSINKIQNKDRWNKLLVSLHYFLQYILTCRFNTSLLISNIKVKHIWTNV